LVGSEQTAIGFLLTTLTINRVLIAAALAGWAVRLRAARTQSTNRCGGNGSALCASHFHQPG